MIEKDDIVQKIASERIDRQVRAQSNAAYFAAHNAEFAALYHKLTDLEVAYAGAFDDASRQAEIKEEKQKVNESLNALLSRAKIDRKEVFFVPVCEKCADTGFLSDGSFCDCVIKRWINESIENCGLSPYRGVDLGNVSFATGRQQQEDIEKLYGVLKNYAARYPDVKNKNIVLIGGTGTGKSCALAALGMELLKNGNTVLFISSCALSELFLKYHRASPEIKPYLFEDILGVDYLIIDDLGVEPIYKNVSEQYLLYVLNIRAERGLGTAVSTNLPEEKLTEKYNDRIASRLLDTSRSWVKRLNGNDLRRQ